MKPYQLNSFSIVYKGEFHFQNLYKLCREWILDNGYGPDKWMEELYLQRDSPGGSEHWIWWRCEKKINSWMKYIFWVDFHTLALGNKEIVHEGQKVKTNKGEVEIFIKVQMQLDPKGEWDKHWFLKNEKFRQWWLKRVNYDEIDRHEGLLIEDANRLQGIIKQYLDLKGFLTEYSGELFHAVKGHE